MNLKEFEALQPGDVITNGTGQRATVTVTSPTAVHVRWSDNPASPVFALLRHSTVWYGFDIVRGTDPD